MHVKLPGLPIFRFLCVSPDGMKEGGPELVVIARVVGAAVVGAAVVGAAVVETVLDGSARLRGSVVLEALKVPSGPAAKKQAC